MARTSQPLPYTASPTKLAIADLLLWARITFVWPPWRGIPSIILPILPYRSGPLDELYPTPANLWSLVIQLIFTAVQALFLISLPISAVFGVGFPLLLPFIGAYTPIWLSWILLFILTNRILSIILLNGTRREFTSQIPLSASEIQDHANEKWVFVNGVAAGSHWMQLNLDRLSLTFRREIYGIHNQTRGILFDLIECILERTFSYPTPSTRIVYQRLLNIVSNPQYKRIIVILHSQGAIEGGLSLDWLFATVPGDQLQRLEIYTFGSAANHFNNPVATTMDSTGKRIDLDDSDSFQQGRVLHHIEHYANSGDYVAKFGILNFRPLPSTMTSTLPSRKTSTVICDTTTTQEIENRYVGRLFIREGTGHQLTGNYFDDFFPMNKPLTKVLDHNTFMDGIVDMALLEDSDIVAIHGEDVRVNQNGKVKLRRDVGMDAADSTIDIGNLLRAGEVSRLWMYRNGMSPKEE